jgi:hypothetical protein
MKFMMSRDRTIASTCGISIGFKKGVLQLVPPAMYTEVLAAGGVPEDEIPEDEMPGAPTSPEALADREAALFKAFETITLKNEREDFTAGGTPHSTVLSRMLGWSVMAKERDAAWVKFTAGKDD